MNGHRSRGKALIIINISKEKEKRIATTQKREQGRGDNLITDTEPNVLLAKVGFPISHHTSQQREKRYSNTQIKLKKERKRERER